MAGQAQITFRWLLALLGGALLVFGVLLADAAVGQSRRAVVIGLDGSIGPGTAGYVLRSLRESRQEDVAVVVLRLDTPGGLDSAMRAIIRDAWAMSAGGVNWVMSLRMSAGMACWSSLASAIES